MLLAVVVVVVVVVVVAFDPPVPNDLAAAQGELPPVFAPAFAPAFALAPNDAGCVPLPRRSPHVFGNGGAEPACVVMVSVCVFVCVVV